MTPRDIITPSKRHGATSLPCMTFLAPVTGPRKRPPTQAHAGPTGDSASLLNFIDIAERRLLNAEGPPPLLLWDLSRRDPRSLSV